MYFLYALAAILFAACQTKNVTEAERFDASVRKELPFAVDSLRWLDGVDLSIYQFACRDYVATRTISRWLAASLSICAN